MTVSLALRLSSSLELWSSVSQDALPFPLPFPFPLPCIRKISRLRKLSVWRSHRTLFLVIDWLKFCGGNHQIDSYKGKFKISWMSQTIKIKVLESIFFPGTVADRFLQCNHSTESGDYNCRPQLFKRWINLYRWIVQSVFLIVIRWIVIYPTDSAIQRLNNWGL